jgi:hydrogenase maturation factor
VFIATKEALDKVREKNAVETAEILESMSKSNDQTGKVA